MLSEWNEFVRARTGDALAADLLAARDGLVLADLSHWGLIALSGEEAQTFLHGQITNDVRGLSPDRAVFAGYCSAKGRMLANFLVFKRGADILIMLPESLREALQKRLTMFILRSKAKARDAATKQADENRVKFGQTKNEKRAREAEKTRAKRALDAGRIEKPE